MFSTPTATNSAFIADLRRMHQGFLGQTEPATSSASPTVSSPATTTSVSNNRSDLIVPLKLSSTTTVCTPPTHSPKKRAKNWKWDIPHPYRHSGSFRKQLQCCKRQVHLQRKPMSITLHTLAYSPTMTANLGDRQGEIAVMETQRGATTAIELNGERKQLRCYLRLRRQHRSLPLETAAPSSPVQVDPNPQLSATTPTVTSTLTALTSRISGGSPSSPTLP